MGHSYISTRFRRELVLHLYRNLDLETPPGVPLILGVHGPPGEGKTYQCERLFDEIGVHVERVSGGELEDYRAGEPAVRIRRAYEKAAAHRAGAHAPAVVFVNDLDMAIGDRGDRVQYTVNRQNVCAELMNLADFPHAVNDLTVARVPVVVTANELTQLDGPLIRHGRMRRFHWLPAREERLETLAALLPELGEDDREKLLTEFPDGTIAFFASLRGVAEDDSLWDAISEFGVCAAFGQLAEGRSFRTPDPPRLDALIDAGRLLVEASRVQEA